MKVERINKNTGKVETVKVKETKREDIAPGCKEIDVFDLFAQLYNR